MNLYKNNVLFLVLVLTSLSLVQAQDLQSYISIAIDNSPVLKSAKIRYETAVEKENEAQWLPNTEITAGYFVSEPETRTGAQRARISLRQMLPWFGTVAARKNYATSIAQTVDIETTIAQRKLTMDVAQAYYKLIEITNKQAILSQNINLLQTYYELALTALKVNQVDAVAILKLNIRRNELQSQYDMLAQEYLAKQTAFNKLLNRDAAITVTSFPILELPDVAAQFELGNLAKNPELLQYDLILESITAAQALNDIESKPMIGLGMDYIPVTARENMNFDENGKDVFMPMVTLSVPLFNKRYTSIEKQNTLREQELSQLKQERLNILETAYAQAVAMRNQARIGYDTQAANLKQAMDAEKIALRKYQSGILNFTELLDIQELQYQFQMKQVSAIQEYYVQSARINYLTL